MNPDRNKNLKPFKPGKDWTGNAGGRPKKRPITDEYFQILGEPVPELIRRKINAQMKQQVLAPGATWGRVNALRRAIDSALPNGHAAAKEMREAMEGKAAQRLEITTAPKTEITIRIKNDRKKCE